MKYFLSSVAFFVILNSCIASMEFDLEPTPLAFRPSGRDARQLQDCSFQCGNALSAVTSAISNVESQINQLSSSLAHLSSDALSITDACSGFPETAYASLSSCPGQRSSNAAYQIAATPPALQQSNMAHTAAPFSSHY